MVPLIRTALARTTLSKTPAEIASTRVGHELAVMAAVLLRFRQRT